jgi:hypothetical protein
VLLKVRSVATSPWVATFSVLMHDPFFESSRDKFGRVGFLSLGNGARGSLNRVTEWKSMVAVRSTLPVVGRYK